MLLPRGMTLATVLNFSFYASMASDTPFGALHTRDDGHFLLLACARR